MLDEATAADTCGKGGMQIFVTMPTGKSLTLDAELSDTIALVKDKIHDKEGIPPRRIRLVYAGHLLDDDTTLADHTITKECTLTLIRVVESLAFAEGPAEEFLAKVCPATTITAGFFEKMATEDAGGIGEMMSDAVGRINSGVLVLDKDAVLQNAATRRKSITGKGEEWPGTEFGAMLNAVVNAPKPMPLAELLADATRRVAAGELVLDKSAVVQACEARRKNMSTRGEAWTPVEYGALLKAISQPQRPQRSPVDRGEEGKEFAEAIAEAEAEVRALRAQAEEKDRRGEAADFAAEERRTRSRLAAEAAVERRRGEQAVRNRFELAAPAQELREMQAAEIRRLENAARLENADSFPPTNDLIFCCGCCLPWCCFGALDTDIPDCIGCACEEECMCHSCKFCCSVRGLVNPFPIGCVNPPTRRGKECSLFCCKLSCLLPTVCCKVKSHECCWVCAAVFPFEDNANDVPCTCGIENPECFVSGDAGLTFKDRGAPETDMEMTR